RGEKGEGELLDSKYQITDTVLGKGTFAEIRLAYKKDSQKQMAVKIMEKRNFSLNGTAGGGTNYVHEINLLRGIRHPNIVRVYDVDETAKHVYIFMPLLRGGDLFDYIYSHERLEEDEAKFIVYQVLLALKYLHDANIAHRDLKPENTLLVSKDAYSQVMLTDFGMAKAAGQQELMKTMCGTFQYIAPEMLAPGVRPGQTLETGYTTAVDCWSLGVMIYAMVSGMLPFSDEDGNPQVLFAQIKSGDLDFSFPCWSKVSIECQSFIVRLLQVDPQKRMSVDKAFKHPWIARDEARLAKMYARGRSDAEPSSADRTPSPEHECKADAGGSKRPVDCVQSPARKKPQQPDDNIGSAIPMGPPPAKRPRQP
ncbi:hypothetical protein GGF43_002693, partial [Coemansia sp. RSA 2618]